MQVGDEVTLGNPSDPTGELSSLTTAIEKDYEALTKNCSPNSQRAINEAEKNNLDVVFPKDNELQIDIDNEHAFVIFEKMVEILDRHYGVYRIQTKPSRSGLPKRHVTVTLRDKISNMERIALQACVGSDRVREILSVVQEKNGDPHATLFLEAKQGF